ncbi:unnamed protein product [Cyprideis torosa]|uniref:Uncharacterized protein n=1 Tax=Cyprideis torosa TaxID=163714 RepID=A0A7R8ZL09_9CRUS|nr:unnamed protein product [Cyprideis torosa]CAG0885535.1 unnamed protein product [Cyprideis torosa]
MAPREDDLRVIYDGGRDRGGLTLRELRRRQLLKNYGLELTAGAEKLQDMSHNISSANQQIMKPKSGRIPGELEDAAKGAKEVGKELTTGIETAKKKAIKVKQEITNLMEDMKTRFDVEKLQQRGMRLSDVLGAPLMYFYFLWTMVYCGCIITGTSSLPLWLRNGGKTLPFAQSFLYFGAIYSFIGFCRFALDSKRESFREIHDFTWFWFPRVGLPLITLEFLQKFNTNPDLQRLVLTLAGVAFLCGVSKKRQPALYLANACMVIAGLLLVLIAWNKKYFDAVAGVLLFILGEIFVQQYRGTILLQSGYTWRTLIMASASLLLVISLTEKGAETFTWGRKWPVITKLYENAFK